MRRNVMKSMEIMKDIYWVGALDWNIRDFHGYTTYKGTTYNAFLVMDEKITLFDTVKKPFRSDLLHNIRKIVDPAKIDYIVINHVEMDHSSCLPEIVDIVKPEKIFCSAMGRQALMDHFHEESWPYKVVQTGQSVKLGRRTVQFLETRMLHWPDSMFSYLQEDRLLISSDAFGQHWVTSERFDDEVDRNELFKHAAKYFANILLLYAPLVKKLIASVRDLGLSIDMIAPDHGLIWRSNPAKIIEAYDTWSEQQPKRKALIIYDTMWQSTEMMAKAIASGLAEQNVSYQLFDLKGNHRSDVMTEVLDAGALIFGSSTLNNGMLPNLADMLHYLRGLRPQNKIGAAFGSYGWSGEAVKLINQALEEVNVELVSPGVRVRYVPDHDALRQCVELGGTIGKVLKERT
jgi:flavorubredoxin